MFNVLNKFISRLDSDSAPQPSTPSGGDSSYGFQVLRNTNKELPIEPWFDFVIGINGHFIVRVKRFRKPDASTDVLQENPDPNLFATEVRNCAGSSLSLDIWSAKVPVVLLLSHFEIH
jgi:hypothetical protein